MLDASPTGDVGGKDSSGMGMGILSRGDLGDVGEVGDVGKRAPAVGEVDEVSEVGCSSAGIGGRS